MSGITRNDKNSNFEKTHPGCLGRMVNLFELNIGMSRNRLLSDKPHRDGFPLSRSRSDVSRMSPSENATEEKVILNDFSNRKANGTPMKMLIAQEMSKEVDTRRDPPNLVAKLMGLDALPKQEPDLPTQRSHSRGHPRSHSDIPVSCWEEQKGFSHYVDPNEYKDVLEIWQQSQKGRYEEALNDKRMALVRQKFMEAKRLSTDEKLRQSKQFQDALEVLSTNKDLFLKCLQEPNSMFCEHLYEQQSVPPPPETKRITVLRPSRMADSNEYGGGGNKDHKQKKKGSFLQLNGSEKIHPGSSPPASLKYFENPTQPTRIVVLKPSLGKTHDAKVVCSPQSEPPMSHNEHFFGDVEDDENQESKEVAKAITQEMRKKIGRHHRDETLISSVLSNGYVGDESSFNKSEIEYDNDNISDSEAMSPLSRHSWDYVNRLGSPFSSSSFSRASHSPESSVCREAKKRLSERWAMMASTGSSQEQRCVRRSSSTLGEMLALSETKKADSPQEESSSSQEPQKDATFLLDGDKRREENMDKLTRNLMRSKSVPVSSTEIADRLSLGISVAGKGKAESAKEAKKASSNLKTSFKGKVSSFFFSRNKKPVKENFLVSETKDEFHSFPGEIGSDGTESLLEKGSDHASPGLLEPSSKASSSNLIDKEGIISPGTELAMEKPTASGNLGENQDQPSPISVLDQIFEEHEHSAKVLPHGIDLPPNSIGSNLIDKSPPIGSIARTLSWDDSSLDTASSHPKTESLTTQHTQEEEEEEEQDWFFFVKTLLSVSGLQDDEPSNSSFLLKWHSSESPLDPSLRDIYIDSKDKENTFHEAKARQKVSAQKLVFDCVNETLVDCTIPCYGAHSCVLESRSSSLVDEVWARMNLSFSSDVRCVSDDFGDDNCLVVERLVRKEIVGKGWIGHFRLEMDCLGKDIEEKLIEELLHELVIELF